MSSEDFIECPELSGKTIQTARLYRNVDTGTEMQIDLTDGTSFSCALRNQPALEAILFEGGAGSPKVLRNYTA
jgi:hypothetical protein